MNFIEAVKETYPSKIEFSRAELWNVATSPFYPKSYKFRKQFTEFMTNPQNKISRGLYKIDGNRSSNVSADTQNQIQLVAAAPKVATKPTLIKQEDNLPLSVTVDNLDLVPIKDRNFIPFGEFSRLKNIISSQAFFPVYIAGESGNGKTKMVEQVCAYTKREMIRANITSTTDEDDLIGGYRLINGETVFQDGPVLEAMKRGAILLLDEINLGTAKIMCLQPVLEGNPIYVKKTNTLVRPKKGFNVIATGNTKGKSTSTDGRYIGSNILNEAMLDRFAITIEHEYPSENIERKILRKSLNKFDNISPDMMNSYQAFIENLIKWAKNIRETFKAGGIEEVITTRRLKHILEFHIIDRNSKIAAIKSCTSRFNQETAEAFVTLYNRIDAEAEANPNAPEVSDDSEESNNPDE